MSIEGYLSHYAEAEVSLVSTLTERWQYAVVVPCCDEFDGVPPLLASLERAALSSAANAVVVLVVNGREDAAESVHETNARLINQLGGAGLHSHSSRLDLLVIDRASPQLRLPSRQGVGLARKIGCDVVTALHQAGRLASRWIWTTDGDVEVPADYFTTVQEHSESVAINLPFVHVELPSQPRAAAAIRLYDLSLRYYVAGLKHAASPYAFHTIGSTMVVRIDAYAKVRGFPRRQAAEDFHLLSKLAKVGSVATGRGAPLRVQGRVSDRVPFGTGAAVSKLVAQEDPEASFLLYDPRCFDELKLWLSAFEGYAMHRDELEWRNQIAATSGLSEQVREHAVSDLKILPAMQRAVSASASNSVVSRHLETWFDGLKTLRFIHLLRDQQWPKLPWREAITKAPFMDLE